MSNFITKTEVVNIAFNRDAKFNKGLITDELLSLSEESHIRPILGDDFYDRLNVVTPSPALNAYETVLMTHIKNALAFYVKYEVLPHLSAKVTSSGIHLENTHQAVVGGVQERREIQSQVLRQADLFGNIIKRYLTDNSSNLSYYKAADTVQSSRRKYGGLIL